METLEQMYTGLLQEHDIIQASNPWGCNQYGHRKGHQGKADSVSEKSRGKEETSSMDDEVDKFEKASPKERSSMLEKWKDKIRKAEEKYELYLSRNSKKAKTPEYEQEKQRLKGEFEKEVSNFKEKIRKVGKKRGWDDKEIEKTIIGVTMGIRTELRV